MTATATIPAATPTTAVPALVATSHFDALSATQKEGPYGSDHFQGTQAGYTPLNSFYEA